METVGSFHVAVCGFRSVRGAPAGEGVQFGQACRVAAQDDATFEMGRTETEHRDHRIRPRDGSRFALAAREGRREEPNSSLPLAQPTQRCGAAPPEWTAVTLEADAVRSFQSPARRFAAKFGDDDFGGISVKDNVVGQSPTVC